MDNMPRFYRYVGPKDILKRTAGDPRGLRVISMPELAEWVRSSGLTPNREDLIALTFVVDSEGFLRVADRFSEHVACAGGDPVLSAGEMFIRLTEEELLVQEISNQSTGYCPEPESWPAVAAALEGIGLVPPGRFTHEMIFRRCPTCRERNLVKDRWFVCGVCDSILPDHWNFDEEK